MIWCKLKFPKKETKPPVDLDKILPITISGVRPEDETGVIHMIKTCGLHTDDLTKEKLRHFIIARKGDRFAGAVGLEANGKQALLRSLAVSEPFRNRGLGTRLVVSLENYAADLNVTAVYLLTLTAREFFQKRGYKACDREAVPSDIKNTSEFKTICPETAVCLCKNL
jgi:amino-acid N-acetyltransferase